MWSKKGGGWKGNKSEKKKNQIHKTFFFYNTGTHTRTLSPHTHRNTRLSGNKASG